MSCVEFSPFPKMPRLSRNVIVSEKIDGTNATIFIGEDGTFKVGSRTRWISPDNDNFGFAGWAWERKDILMNLGPGWHRGEWWGRGVQRGYSLDERRFSLFNTERWTNDFVRPSCCHVVPVLYQGDFDTDEVDHCLNMLEAHGSVAAPGFMQPEGVVVFHTAANIGFKKTIEKDEQPKGARA